MTFRPGLAWAIAATATVLAAAAWLRQPATLILLLCAGGTVWSVALSWHDRRVVHRAGFGLSAVAFVTIAFLAARSRGAQARYPALARAAVETRGTTAMAAALDAEIEALKRLAVGALDAPAERSRAFAFLDELRGGAAVRSVVVVRGGTPHAWTGQLVAPLDSLRAPVGALATPFYLVVYAIAGRGTDRAVAEALVNDERPADPTSAERSAFTIVSSAGLPVLGVRAVAPPGELLAERALERGRARGGIALALAVAFFLVGAWGGRARVVGRLAGLRGSLAPG